MTTPPTATPRTDAALLTSDCAYNCGHTFKLLIEEKYDQGKCVSTGPDIAWGNAGVVVLADFARQLETELARLRAEVSEARRAWLGDDYGHLPLVEALEKFCSDSDAESDRADVLYQRSCEVEHKLRAEVERLTKRIADDNKAYGCELRDPNGTIWEQAAKDHARAARAEAALTEAIDGVIDGGSIPDTLLVIHIPRSPVGYRVGQPVKVILPAIDAAMKEASK
jgi:hypothetical protein